MNLKRTLLYVLLIIAFTSCETEVENPKPNEKEHHSHPSIHGRIPLDSEGEPIGIIQTKNHGLIDSDVYFLDSIGDTLNHQRTILGEASFSYFDYGSYQIHSEESGYIPSHKSIITSSSDPNPLCDHILIPQ